MDDFDCDGLVENANGKSEGSNKGDGKKAKKGKDVKGLKKAKTGVTGDGSAVKAKTDVKAKTGVKDKTDKQKSGSNMKAKTGMKDKTDMQNNGEGINVQSKTVVQDTKAKKDKGKHVGKHSDYMGKKAKTGMNDKMDMQNNGEGITVKGVKAKTGVKNKKATTVDSEGLAPSAKQQKLAPIDTWSDFGVVMGKASWNPDLRTAKQIPGGLTLGVDCAGMMPEMLALNELKIPHTVVWATEQDEKKRKVIRHLHGEGFHMYQTVLERNQDKNAKDCDVLCGGPPCQPFSRSGLNLGTDDMRGIVVFEIIDYVKRRRPRLLILENVMGLVNAHWDDFKDLCGTNNIICDSKSVATTRCWRPIHSTRPHI
jgi:hypothetical protein